MEIIPEIALISINETLIVQVVSFLAFLFLINRIMFRPLRDTMIEREMHIANIRRAIDEAEGELTKVLRRLENNEAAARIEARTRRSELEEAGKREAQQEIESARREIERMTEAAESELQTKLQEERSRLQAEAGTLAEEIVRRFLGRTSKGEEAR
jgi:F-type H+-transporting ATPase subunit b